MRCDAEVIDQFQRLFRTNACNDHQLHCVLRFEVAPDLDLLKEAVTRSIEAIPILGSRYVVGSKPHWAPQSPDASVGAFAVVHTEAQFTKFVISRVDEMSGPQVKVCFLDAHPFAMAVKMNHMVCDAAGFKQFLYFLCGTYSAMLINRAYRPPAVRGDRGMSKVLSGAGTAAKLKALLRCFKRSGTTKEVPFPFHHADEAQPFILTRKLSKERTEVVRSHSRAASATINDVVLAAYYRCLFDILGKCPGERLSISVTVDMRRYLKNGTPFMALTNLSSSEITELECKPGEEFKTTLRRVKAMMDARKREGIGLDNFIKLYFAYRIFGNRGATYLLSWHPKRHSISMTNIGILEPAKLSLGELCPYDVFLCGSIKYRSHFQLAISSYKDELTLSVNLYGSINDQKRIISFFDQIEAQLPSRL